VTNVVTLKGGEPVPEAGTPNPVLIEALDHLLAMAKEGQLQSFIGTGFVVSGARMSCWVDHHPDVYQMRGALAWLESEYVHRHTAHE
jgi:hypothetical protein